jgi:hypothetical protein
LMVCQRGLYLRRLVPHRFLGDLLDLPVSQHGPHLRRPVLPPVLRDPLDLLVGQHGLHLCRPVLPPVLCEPLGLGLQRAPPPCAPMMLLRLAAATRAKCVPFPSPQTHDASSALAKVVHRGLPSMARWVWHRTPRRPPPPGSPPPQVPKPSPLPHDPPRVSGAFSLLARRHLLA